VTGDDAAVDQGAAVVEARLEQRHVGVLAGFEAPLAVADADRPARA
jgi:hypothetical protein